MLVMNPEILIIRTLKEAEKEIAKINVNPIGVKIMALKAIQVSVKFKSVDSKTANIVKQEMLSRGGDVAVSRDVGSFEAEKTDMIIIGTLAQYVRLVRKLKHQTAFDCKKIAKEIQSLLLEEFGIDIDKTYVW